MATSIAPDVRGTELKRDIYETAHTSTGVGHHWRPGYYFPSSNFKVIIIVNFENSLAAVQFASQIV